MAAVTAWGDFDLTDRIAMQRFIDAHARRHRLYVAILGIYGGTLRGEIDADWMHRHAARHVSLATVTGIDLSSADTKALALPGIWRSEQELQDWTELHNRIHSKIDQQLKLSG